MLRPIYLQPGDKVALISPAGVPKTDNIDYAVNLLRSWELIPVLSKHIYARNGQLAGTDQERLVDLQVMLDDEEIRAIWCTTGGYGTLRLVEEADYSTFQGTQMDNRDGRHHHSSCKTSFFRNRESTRLYAGRLLDDFTGGDDSTEKFPVRNHFFIFHPSSPVKSNRIR